MATISEELFERYCELNGILCTRIAEGEQKRPDYRLNVAGTSVLAEVKKIDPDDADRRMLRQTEEAGSALAYRGELGARIRPKIAKAASQLSKLASSEESCIVVIFNNVFTGFFTDQTNVMAAMYSGHEFRISLFAEGEEFAGERLGGKRRLTEEHNTTVSAVCMLFTDPDGVPYLVVYYNHFAAVPLDPAVLRLGGNVQFRFKERTGGAFPMWEEVLE